jgi:3-hydroxyisobutyrate dehydrogenase-like beta-hydroxyacid dehydrogenase
MRLGFIGIGMMGMPMSRNLLKKSGYPLMVYDVNEEAVKQLASEGAAAADNARQIVENCDVIFTMLPRNEHVRSVYQEIADGVRPGQIYVEMSTISPEVSREMADLVREKGADLLDAPVVKSRPAAVSGTLGIYVGGRKATYETVLPLLQCMGSNIIYLGENGSGLVMKLCHNLLVAEIQNGVNEVLHLAEAVAGIEPETFAKAASYGGAQTFYLDSKAEVLQKGDFTPAFAAEYMHKDLSLAKELCAQAGLVFDGAETAFRRYEEVMKAGWGKEDFSCTYKLFDDEVQK